MTSDHNSEECALNSHQRDKVIGGSTIAKDPQHPEEEGEEHASAGMMGSVLTTLTVPLSIGVWGVEEIIRG